MEVADPAARPATELVRMATAGGYRFLGEPGAGRLPTATAGSGGMRPRDDAATDGTAVRHRHVSAGE